MEELLDLEELSSLLDLARIESLASIALPAVEDQGHHSDGGLALTPRVVDEGRLRRRKAATETRSDKLPMAAPSLLEPYRGASIMTVHERSEAARVASHCIAGSTETSRGVAKTETYFRQYSEGMGWLVPPGDLFMLGDSDQVQLEKIISFYEWMRTHDTSVQRSHDALATAFQRALSCCTVFSSDALLKYVAGAKRIATDTRTIMLRRLANRKMAMPLNWLPSMRAYLWRWNPVSNADIDLSLAYLVIMIQLHTLMRISNWAHTAPDFDARRVKPVARDRDDKHVVRAGDVFLIINDRCIGIALHSRDRSRDRIVPSHLWDRRHPTHVIAMVFVVLTKKSDKYYPELKWVKRGNGGMETQFLTDLLTSLELAPSGQAYSELPFFCRIGVEGEVRKTRSSDVSQAGKNVAAAHGFDPHSFSTTSNRVSGISSLAKMGLPTEDIQVQSGHRSAAVLINQYTQRNSHSSSSSSNISSVSGSNCASRGQQLSVLEAAYSPSAGWDQDDLEEQLMVVAFARARLFEV